MRFISPHAPRFMRVPLPALLASTAVVLSLRSAAAMQLEADHTGEQLPSADGTESPASELAVSSEALRITVDPGIDDADLLPDWIQEAAAVELSKLSPRAEQKQWVEIKLTGASFRFELLVIAKRGGTTVGELAEPTRCECNTKTLLELVTVEVAAAVEQLNAPIERLSDEENETKPPQPLPPQPNDGDKQDVKRYRPTGLGLAGFILTGLGGASLVGGVVMITRPLVPIEQPSYLVRNWGPPGVGFTAGGAAVLAGGIAMWVTDLVLCRKKGLCGLGARRKKASAMLTPSWRIPGVGITGRF